jgi:flagellar FliL protein
MSTQAAPAPAAPAAAPEAKSEKKSGMFWKLVVLGLIASVIGAECLFAFVYVSMATDKAVSGEAGTAAAPAPKHDGHGEPAEHAKHGETGKTEGSHEGSELEIDLGEYSLTAFQPASNTTLLIDFHLYGTIATEEEHGFTEHFDSNKHRIRDQVITTIRSAELADLTDPGLGLIKRQILEKTNRALGKPLLQGIVFSDFLVVEQ